MHKANRRERSPFIAVEVGRFDRVHPGIDPVELVQHVVYGQAVRPDQVMTHNDDSVGSIHPRPLDEGMLTPVGPEHDAGTRIWTVVREEGTLVHGTDS